MKILIEESVLRQALEALIDFNQQSIGGIALPAEIDAAMDALRTALDAAEKVDDQLRQARANALRGAADTIQVDLHIYDHIDASKYLRRMADEIDGGKK